MPMQLWIRQRDKWFFGAKGSLVALQLSSSGGCVAFSAWMVLALLIERDLASLIALVDQTTTKLSMSADKGC